MKPCVFSYVLYDDVHIPAAVFSEEDCPRIIIHKVMKTFTVESFSNGRCVLVALNVMRMQYNSMVVAQ